MKIEYIMKDHFGAILLTLLLLAGCNSSAVQEDQYIVIKTGQTVNPTPDIPMKGICIFAGQAEVFTASDWQALANSSLTDFVIIAKDASVYGSGEAGYKSQLAPFMANIVNQIVSRKSSSKVWIGTPGLSSLNYNLAASSLEPIYNYLTQVRTLVGSTIWDKNIGGVYMNMESVYGSVDYSNILANSCIKLMSDLSARVHTSLKTKFLWIPYYGYGADPSEVIKRIGYVSNKSGIYDYVVIQPHYYFDAAVGVNLAGVKNCIINQAITYRDGTIVTPKASQTVIGVEMELDWHVVPPNNYADFLGRYNEYVSSFTTYRGLFPILFYWDGTLQNALSGRINPFFQ
jgi:hypothetical protein